MFDSKLFKIFLSRYNNNLRKIKSIYDIKRWFEYNFPIRIVFSIFFIIAILLFFYGTNWFNNELEIFNIYDLTAYVISFTIIIIIILCFLIVMSSYIINIYIIKSNIDIELINHIVDFKENKYLNIKLNISRLMLIPPGALINIRLFLEKKEILHEINIKSSISDYSYEIEIDLDKRGIYKIDNLRISFLDILGFFRIYKNIPIKKDFKIYTNKKEIKHKNLEHSFSYESNIKDILNTMNDDYSDLKKYEPGDDIRKIHWKIFANKRELIVKKNELNKPKLKDIALFFAFENNYNNFLVNNRFLSDINDLTLSMFNTLTHNIIKSEQNIILGTSCSNNILKLPNHNSKFFDLLSEIDFLKQYKIKNSFDDFINSILSTKNYLKNINIFIDPLISSYEIKSIIEKLLTLNITVSIYYIPIKDIVKYLNNSFSNNKFLNMNYLIKKIFFIDRNFSINNPYKNYNTILFLYEQYKKTDFYKHISTNEKSLLSIFRKFNIPNFKISLKFDIEN